TRRRDAREQSSLAEKDKTIVAIAADYPVENSKVPVFDLDDTHAIADFVEQTTGLSGLQTE
ncbi:MAG: molybdopterin-guanine dinucleotide biosynthesis protein B, partial [Pseudomonadota bacterium]